MKSFILKYRLEIIGLMAGAVVGWLYWFFIGCSSGTCAITSSPVNSTIYMAVMGALIFGMFKKEKKEKNHEEQGRIN